MYAKEKNSSKEIYKLLIEKGADVNIKDKSGKTVKDYKYEPEEYIPD